MSARGVEVEKFLQFGRKQSIVIGRHDLRKTKQKDQEIPVSKTTRVRAITRVWVLSLPGSVTCCEIAFLGCWAAAPGSIVWIILKVLSGWR